MKNCMSGEKRILYKQRTLRAIEREKKIEKKRDTPDLNYLNRLPPISEGSTFLVPSFFSPMVCWVPKSFDAMVIVRCLKKDLFSINRNFHEN